jgi:hypothetical protein
MKRRYGHKSPTDLLSSATLGRKTETPNLYSSALQRVVDGADHSFQLNMMCFLTLKFLLQILDLE